jgi:hypothetical protein
MNEDPEISALMSVCSALSSLDSDAQQRVIDYVIKRLHLQQSARTDVDHPPAKPDVPFGHPAADDRSGAPASGETENDGISPVAAKWMRRNDLSVSHLAAVFSVGADEIDLIAKTVPGDSKKSRARSVVLLKAIAAYLSTGASRISAEQIKEACLHYDAFDQTNHSTYIKAMAAELGGGKTGGYTLTPRGLTAGTELIREMLGKKAGS